MTKREEWLPLAERCEKATGPDQGIDWDILMVLCGDYDEGWLCASAAGRYAIASRGSYSAPEWTGSLDAITALIERELPGWALNSGRTPDEFKLVHEPNFTASVMGEVREVQFGYNEPPELTYTTHEAKAATEPLARCAAFCRAMAEKEGVK